MFETNNKECFVGSSVFMMMNLDNYERPDYVQLNLGYWINVKDVFSLKLKTWRNFKPLGLPYSKKFNLEDEKFPGFIRERGLALAYQRFLWKGLYTGVHMMSSW